MAFNTACDAVLTARLNLRFGIPDHIYLLGASAISDAISQFK